MSTEETTEVAAGDEAIEETPDAAPVAPRREYTPVNPKLRPEGESYIKRRAPGLSNQPLANIEWVDPDRLYANNWNPNRVHGPEARLLKISMLESGWLSPISVVEEDDGLRVVDAFHRWTLACRDPEIRAIADGKVPVVRVEGDAATIRMTTIRMNRARGTHHVVRMADIVAELLGLGCVEEEIIERLQMDAEEVFRLSQRGDMTKLGSGDGEFGSSWAPDHDTDRESTQRQRVVHELAEAERKGRRKTEPVRGSGRDDEGRD